MLKVIVCLYIHHGFCIEKLVTDWVVSGCNWLKSEAQAANQFTRWAPVRQ
jgi:hypothetical protein